MVPPALLAIDVGTSGIKVVAFATNGTMLANRREATPTTRYADGRAEHDLEAIWGVVAALVSEVVSDVGSSRIAGAGVASVGEAGVPVDAHGSPIRPAIAWFDSRGEAEADWWRAEAGEDAIGQITGLPIDPHNGAYRLMWLRSHEPEVFDRTWRWLSLADAIIHRLCGAVVTDVTLASRTGLFDQLARRWSVELMNLSGLDPSLFPEAVESGTQVGGISYEASLVTGLVPGTPVVTGGHDRLCAAFAARGVSDAPVDSVGSAEAVVVSVPAYSPRSPSDAGYVASYADVVPGGYVLSARVGYAAALVDWYKRELERTADPTTPTTMDSEVGWPLRYSGLLVYPSFGRVIAPEWDPSCRPGAIVGLTLAHTRGDVLQALVEGASYSLRANLNWLERLTGTSLGRLAVEGSLTGSRVWMQIKADVTGRQILGLRMVEATALGAALLAGVGAGVFRDHAAAASAIDRGTERWDPDPQRAATYTEVYEHAFRHVPQFLREVAPSLLAVAANAPPGATAGSEP